MNDVSAVRAAFARELMDRCEGRSESLRRAFASVPREDFLSPPPWLALAPDGTNASTSDPADLYRDVLVAIDAKRMLCNGSPILWAIVYDALRITPGERVVHVGTGTGYYTAILAELVGERGDVLGIEIDPELAERSSANLRKWPHATVTCDDGAQHPGEPADVIVINAGATHVVEPWLDGLRPGGRLYVPLTIDPPGPASAFGLGAGFVVRRTPELFSATCLNPLMIFHCSGTRNGEAHAALSDAYRRRSSTLTAVRTLRRDAHAEDETCWCHVDRACLSLLDQPA